MTNPRQYKIPDWFLNRQKDIVDGKYSQVKDITIKFQLNIQKDRNNLNLIIKTRIKYELSIVLTYYLWIFITLFSASLKIGKDLSKSIIDLVINMLHIFSFTCILLIN